MDEASADSKIQELEGRLTSMQREMDALRASVSSIADEAAEKAIGSLIIHNGQNISFSGKGRNISANVTTAGLQGVLQGSVQCVDGVGVLTGSVTF